MRSMRSMAGRLSVWMREGFTMSGNRGEDRRVPQRWNAIAAAYRLAKCVAFPARLIDSLTMTGSNKPEKISDTSALARHLGLSRWTVSRALNGHPGVKAETVRRVHEAMEEIGFSPNLLARGLRGGKTGVIGVCYQSFGTAVFSQKLLALQRSLRANGYRAMIELIESSAELEWEAIKHFLSLKAEGIIFVGGPAGDNARKAEKVLKAEGVAAVAIDPIGETVLPRVALDREYAMEIAIARLVELGHRKIALFGIEESVLYGNVRIKGLKKAAKRFGLDWSRDVQQYTDQQNHGMDYTAGRSIAQAALDSASFSATAVFAINDQVAIGAMGKLQESGKRVPEDISIIGFDNLDVASHLHPTLATIDQRIGAVTDLAIDTLVAQIRGAAPQAFQSVKPLLIDGESLRQAARSR